MLPFEFVVLGTPLSQQARNRTLLREWRSTVREAALRRWPAEFLPLATPLQMIVVYFHDGSHTRMDTDNLVKPIQDAPMGLIYVDDVWITDTWVRKTDLNGTFRPRGMSRALAEGFFADREFVYIRIERAPNHRELL